MGEGLRGNDNLGQDPNEEYIVTIQRLDELPIESLSPEELSVICIYEKGLTCVRGCLVSAAGALRGRAQRCPVDVATAQARLDEFGF